MMLEGTSFPRILGCRHSGGWATWATSGHFGTCLKVETQAPQIPVEVDILILGLTEACLCGGTISFDELDRKAAAALEKFRVMSLMHHKSIEHMWKAPCQSKDSQKQCLYMKKRTLSRHFLSRYK